MARKESSQHINQLFQALEAEIKAIEGKKEERIRVAQNINILRTLRDGMPIAELAKRTSYDSAQVSRFLSGQWRSQIKHVLYFLVRVAQTLNVEVTVLLRANLAESVEKAIGKLESK